ncbi:hypothetical protein CARUB_v10018777mg [Capsella rubella]|uniref:ENT domain-containing protein n=1 Tax=Capsella rubella TaxID=81985 RepID=R0FSP3_9BRAS|nr:hypothetical protein CARUB_v10018777mg [Capsella rubella]
MSDQKDQPPSSPSQSTELPIKKRDFTEPMTSYRIDADILLSHMDKKEKLNTLQGKAYFYVLHAFSAESPEMSNPRTMIMRELMKEWNITLETLTKIEDAIKADPVVQQLRNVSLASDEKEMQKLTATSELSITGVEGQPLKFRVKPNRDDWPKIGDRVLAPAKIQDGKVIPPAEIQGKEVIPPAEIQGKEAKPSSTSDDSPAPSWGQVSPWSLVGKWVGIKMPYEDEHIRFLIKEYDEKTETHQLVSDFSKQDFEDPCNWIDIRHIPAEDMEWQSGHPGLPVWKCFPKPGETLLLKTSTARNKKQLQEVGKTSTGIPIIRKVDKGKSPEQ